MNATRAILTRRSTRKFTDKLVEQEKLDAVLEAGRNAPSGHNSQACHFYVIRNKETLISLAKVVEKAFATMQYDEKTYASLRGSIERSKQGGYIFHYSPAVFIIVANKQGYDNAMADSACALENMMIEANEQGLGSVWINQLHWLENDESVRDYLATLGVSKTEVLCGALSLGYADTENGEPNRTPKQITGNPVTYLD